MVWLNSGQWSEFERGPWLEAWGWSVQDAFCLKSLIRDSLCLESLIRGNSVLENLVRGNFRLESLFRDNFGLQSLIRRSFGSGSKPGWRTLLISNGRKTKLNSIWVMALSLSYWPNNPMSEKNSSTNRSLTLASNDLQLRISTVPRPNLILMKWEPRDLEPTSIHLSVK